MKSTIKVVESQRHGKATKGNKKTSSWQVRDYCLTGTDYLLLKQVTFKRGSIEAKNSAYMKALEFAKTVK